MGNGTLRYCYLTCLGSQNSEWSWLAQERNMRELFPILFGPTRRNWVCLVKQMVRWFEPRLPSTWTTSPPRSLIMSDKVLCNCRIHEQYRSWGSALHSPATLRGNACHGPYYLEDMDTKWGGLPKAGISTECDEHGNVISASSISTSKGKVDYSSITREILGR